MRFVIIGGGPAGNQAATHAARLGVDVTLIERDVVGGAANLWDCIPSKAMIATGGAMSYLRRIAGMGVVGADGVLDLELLRDRITGIVDHLEHTNEKILRSQQVNVVRGTARLVDAHTVVADTAGGTDDLRGRRRPAQHRQPPPDPALGRPGRRPAPDHPRRLSAQGAARTTWWSSARGSPGSSSSTCSPPSDAR